jgi:hypothetical protein
MNQPRGAEVGAELAELYKKGRDTLPLVHGEISSAATNVINSSAVSAMSRSGGLGVGSQGCYSEFSAARSSLYGHLNALGTQLESCGVNIMKTAQDLADVDDVTAAAFTKHGGEFPQ